MSGLSRAHHLAKCGSNIFPAKIAGNPIFPEYFSQKIRFLFPKNRRKEPTGIGVLVKADAVVLVFRSWRWGGGYGQFNYQPVPASWTPCAFGGRRPWFRCEVYSRGRYCGRRVALLHSAGGLFACRHCLGLAYASQQEPVRERGKETARKIQMRLGGGESVTEAFPEKPKGMHWRRYNRLRRRHGQAFERSLMGLAKSTERLERGRSGVCLLPFALQALDRRTREKCVFCGRAGLDHDLQRPMPGTLALCRKRRKRLEGLFTVTTRSLNRVQSLRSMRPGKSPAAMLTTVRCRKCTARPHGIRPRGPPRIGGTVCRHHSTRRQTRRWSPKDASWHLDWVRT
jgi:hypothetical protein